MLKDWVSSLTWIILERGILLLTIIAMGVFDYVWDVGVAGDSIARGGLFIVFLMFATRFILTGELRKHLREYPEWSRKYLFTIDVSCNLAIDGLLIAAAFTKVESQWLAALLLIIAAIFLYLTVDGIYGYFKRHPTPATSS